MRPRKADEKAGKRGCREWSRSKPERSTNPGILLSGIVPPLADPYYTRTETGPDLASSLQAGETVVLVHGEESDSAPAAQGGTGKTQLAVEFAHAMWNGRLVEVLVWVTATNRESVITGFAQAANMVDASYAERGRRGGRGALRVLAGAHQAPVGADHRRPGRRWPTWSDLWPGGRVRPDPDHHPAARRVSSRPGTSGSSRCPG